MYTLSFILSVALLIGTGSLTAQVSDKDGNNYNTVKIGQQEWIAENLETSHFRNGDSIPEAEGAAEWKKAGDEGKPAWCYYHNDTVAGKKYHKLYNWFAVNDPRGLAPVGWHIPSTTEWSGLTAFLGGEQIAGAKMKAKSWNGTNESAFEALPGGYRNFSAEFVHLDNIGSWWSSSESDASDAWSRSLGSGNGPVSRSYDGKRVGLSVRCIRD
jgi:uncharacterized protein (TIGR02145 family)